jgi:hypothetical protein
MKNHKKQLKKYCSNCKKMTNRQNNMEETCIKCGMSDSRLKETKPSFQYEEDWFEDEDLLHDENY